jgi:hypothetical protein
LYHIIRTINDVSTLQADIDKLFNWSVAWHMKFNTAKCHILHITRQRNKLQRTYTVNSNTLFNVDSYPYLGITITADLRWREHVQLTATKATRTLNFTGLHIPGSPLMEYACPAWYPYRIGDITLLESVHRRVARFALNDYRNLTSVTTLLNQLEWPPLKKRRQQASLMLFSKALTNDTAISPTFPPFQNHKNTR